MRDERTYKIIGAAIEVHKDLPAIASRSGEAGGVGMWVFGSGVPGSIRKRVQ